MDTPTVQLCNEQFPLKETQKIVEQLLHIRQMRKYLYLNGWFWGLSMILPRDQERWNHSSLPKITRKFLERTYMHTFTPASTAASGRQVTRCLTLITKRASIHDSNRTVANKGVILNQLSHKGSAPNRIFPNLSLKS